MAILLVKSRPSKPSAEVMRAAIEHAKNKLRVQAAPQKLTAARNPDEDLFPIAKLGSMNKYRLTAAEKKVGFFNMYFGFMFKSGSYSTRPDSFFNTLGLSLALKAKPEILESVDASKLTMRKVDSSMRRQNRPYLKVLSEFYGRTNLSQFLRLKKDTVNKQFEIQLPLLFMNSTSITSALMVYTNYSDLLAEVTNTPAAPVALPDGSKDETEEEEESEGDDLEDQAQRLKLPKTSGNALGTAVFSVSDLAALHNKYISTAALAEMKKFVRRFRIISQGPMSILMMDIAISDREAQALTTEPFPSISPLDLFSLVRIWIEGGKTQFNKRPAEFSIPISKIHKHNPPPKDFRVNADGIAIDSNGHLVLIPKEVNNIELFKNQQTEKLLNEDGSYSAVNEDMEPKAHSIGSTVLYVDWVNQKLTYTTLAGNVEVLNMDRFVPAKESHYAAMFRKSILSTNYIQSALSQAFNAAYALVPEFAAFMSSLQVDSFKAMLSAVYTDGVNDGTLRDPAEIRIADLVESTNDAAVAFIGSMKELDNILTKDINIAYSKYSAKSTLTLAAIVRVLAKYDDVASLSQIDQEQRRKYIEQKVDPEYSLEEIPLVRDEKEDNPLGLMPHQDKTMNLMRESPDNAIFGIAAGGGKSLLSVMDYLKEIKRGNVDRALVIAPDHLVATHVREITDFTNGRMNVIPVTSYTYKIHGLEKLYNLITKRPINTAVVVSMGILKRVQRVNYGDSPAEVFFIAEFLRQFNFDYVVIDESHYLKNDSITTRAAHRVMAGIKKKRLMSGTLIPNQPQDLVRQFSLLDPSVFGSEEEFKAEFAVKAPKGGGKVREWKPGYQLEVTRRLRENSVYVQVKRKEWYALLPRLKETFYTVDMSEAQKDAYLSILVEQKADMMAKAPELWKKLEALMEKLKKGNKDSDKPDEEDASDAEIDGEELERLLHPYIARMEQFCTAPAEDPVGSVLEGSDLISPKVVKAAELCRDHFERGIPGKVIIFTNQIASAKATYDYLNSLPEFAGKVLHYKAGNKEMAQSVFLRDPEKKIMVGVGQSMDTGLNLQHASRLIRLESVWTPGKYEQGNSRIHRPVVKSKDRREFVYVDVICANSTIDITKVAFLMTKIITTEQFYNSGNTAYDNLVAPELFAMTMDNIFTMNDEMTLQDHFDKWKAFRTVEAQDLDEYMKAHGDKLDFTMVKRAPNPPGSKMMLRVPYEPGTELYGAEGLGLERYDAHMGMSEKDVQAQEENEDDRETTTQREKSAEESSKAAGLRVHTEDGDGEIIKATQRFLIVRLQSGEEVKASRLNTFVITRKNTNGKDMRLQLNKLNGDIPLDQQPEVPPSDDEIAKKLYQKKVAKQRVRRGEEQQEEEQNTVVVSLSFTVFNDVLALQVDNAEVEGVQDALRPLGFQNPPSYVYTKLVTAAQYVAIFRAWKKAGFTIRKELRDELESFYFIVKDVGLKKTNPHGLARKHTFGLFLRQTFKPNGNPTEIQPFILIADGEYRIALPFKGHAGTRAAVLATRTLSGAPTPKWKEVKPELNMFCYTGSKNISRDKIQEIQRAGVMIGNLDELKKAYAKLQFRAPRGYRE